MRSTREHGRFLLNAGTVKLLIFANRLYQRIIHVYYIQREFSGFEPALGETLQ